MSFFSFLKVITYLPLRVIFPVKLIGKENFNYEKAVICCNHYSAMDVVVIASRLLKGGCYCVGKEETFKTKPVKWLFNKCGAIAIKRGESDIQAFKKILKVLREGKQLLIFPEGTRNKAETPEMLEFQYGAAMFAIKTSSPVIPLVYHKKLRPFRRNYLMVGEPFSMSEFEELPSKEAREIGTKYLYEKMSALKKNLDESLEKSKKKQ